MKILSFTFIAKPTCDGSRIVEDAVTGFFDVSSGPPPKLLCIISTQLVSRTTRDEK